MKLIQKSSFQKKLVWFMVPVIIFINGALFFCYHLSSARIIEQQTQDSMLRNLENAAVYIDDALWHANISLSQFVLDERTEACMEKTPAPWSYAFFEASQYMRQSLSALRDSCTLAESIYVYGIRNEYFFCTDQARTYTYWDIDNSSWTKRLWENNTDCWSALTNDLPFASQREVLTRFKPIRNQVQTQIVGYASINVPVSSLTIALSKSKISNHSATYITDLSGNIVYSASAGGKTLPIGEYLPANQKRASIVQNGKIIACVRSEHENLVYVQETPRSELIAPLRRLTRIAYLLTAIGCLLIFLYASRISKHLFTPIQTLLRHMRSVEEGTLTDLIEEHRNDEFESLYTGYNRMVGQIDQLIQDSYIQKILIRDLRVKSLQSQLSPHFLYNSLDAIHWAARDNQMDEVCKMIYWLSDYFRKGLTSGHDVITVTEVSEIIESYLRLQESRHEGRIHVEIHVAPAVTKYHVMKYLFQPIVENAFKHGLERTTACGNVFIRWEDAGNGRLRFVVQDDGVGMSSEKLETLQKELLMVEYHSDMDEHFALKNIQLQLRLFYDNSTLEISSKEGRGTTVSFLIRPEKE